MEDSGFYFVSIRVIRGYYGFGFVVGGWLGRGVENSLSCGETEVDRFEGFRDKNLRGGFGGGEVDSMGLKIL